MSASASGHSQYHITLRGTDNRTYAGTFVLGNWSILPNTFFSIPEQNGESIQTMQNESMGVMTTSAPEEEYDKKGATYFVIAVLCIYSMSIMMIMLSHVGQRSMKIVEDKQIKKYLLDFQIVREKNRRDDYRRLKKSIVAKLHWEPKIQRKRHILEVIQQSSMSLLAVGLPTVPDPDEIGWKRTFDARTTILGLRRQRTASGNSSMASSLAGNSLASIHGKDRRGLSTADNRPKNGINNTGGSSGCTFSKHDDIQEEDDYGITTNSDDSNLQSRDTVLEIHPYYIEQELGDDLEVQPLNSKTSQRPLNLDIPKISQHIWYANSNGRVNSLSSRDYDSASGRSRNSGGSDEEKLIHITSV